MEPPQAHMNHPLPSWVPGRGPPKWEGVDIPERTRKEAVERFKNCEPDPELVKILTAEVGDEDEGLQALVDIVRERERARLLEGSHLSAYLGNAMQPHPSGAFHDTSISNVDTTSDDFRMYHFKVKMCTKQRAHDWVQCPYAHEGEKAKRRDPCQYNYSGAACPEFRKGNCSRGDACTMAHGVFECWLHPQRYKTQLCREGLQCQRRVCFFAHTPQELRVPEQPPAANPLLPTGIHAQLSQPQKSAAEYTAPAMGRLMPMMMVGSGDGVVKEEDENENERDVVPRPSSFRHLHWIEGLMDEADDESG